MFVQFHQVKNFAKEYKTEGIPFYRGKEIIEKHNGSTVSTELFISLERYEEIKSKYDVPKKAIYFYPL